MATIGLSSIANRYVGRILDGTADADTIFGVGGNDTLFGGTGADRMLGGTGNDIIWANSRGVYTTFAWGADNVDGGSGNDTLYFHFTTSGVTLRGGTGNDAIYSGSGNDFLFGGDGIDTINAGAGKDTVYGDAGDDTINGQDGNDTLYGGDGIDTIKGGAGDDFISGSSATAYSDKAGDWLTGGSGYDTFSFKYQSLTWSTADTVLDFNPAYDYIDAIYKGTSSNYHEAKIAGKGWDAAKAYAASVLDDDTWHVFVTDGKNGYLFTDNSGNDVIDSGIELRGLTSVSQFTYSDII